MYTICPSCKSELSFTLPVSKDQLPDGYKHRLKCPCCGVTIAVKVKPEKPVEQVEETKVNDQAVDNAAEQVEEQPILTEDESVEEVVEEAPEEEEAVEEVAPAKKVKKSGAGRNVVMLLFSLIFVAITVVGYFVEKSYGASVFYNGIDLFNQLSAKASVAELSVIIRSLLPFVLFVIAGIQAIVAIVSLIGKKYSRAFNIVASVIIAGIALVVMLYPVNAKSVGDNMNFILSNTYYMAFVGAGLAVIELILSLAFIKPLGYKED